MKKYNSLFTYTTLNKTYRIDGYFYSQYLDMFKNVREEDNIYIE